MAISGGNEIYRKLSSQIEAQFPEFIRSEGPMFVQFLKAYFEYLEQTDKALDAGRGLPDTLDIDRTVDEFVEYFHREFLINIPRDVEADRRLMAKYIRQFYRTRGSQESYRFLFRAIFNEEIEFYYPGDDILRASDGRWAKETVIRGVFNAGNPDDLDGRSITGATSGATARVQEILRIQAAGLTLYQLTIENVTGTFQEDEVVQDGFGNSIKIFNAVGSISAATPRNGGGKHQVGDVVTLAGDAGGSGRGIITATTDIGPITFTIKQGGSGYRANGNTVFTLSGGDPDFTARLAVLSISNTENIEINTDTIEPFANVTLNTNPFGVGSATMQTKNVNSTLESSLSFANVVVGAINSISVLDVGSGYEGSLPTVTVRDEDVAIQSLADSVTGGFKGRNAQIIASRTYGAIEAISITASDINFLKNDNVIVTNITRQDDPAVTSTYTEDNGQTRGTRMLGIYPATVTAQIKGTFSLPGRYTDTKGMLSWNNKLQDNDYYQEFSYAIKTKQLLDSYRSVLKALVHPAGTKMFGIVQNYTGVDMSANMLGNTTVILYKKANNTITLTGAGNNTVTINAGAHWFSNGVLKANSGAISVGGQGSNLMIVPSVPAGANGLYQVNAISNSSVLTLRRKSDTGQFTNGTFYYQTSYLGGV